MSEEYAFYEDTINNKFTFTWDGSVIHSFKPFEEYTRDDLSRFSTNRVILCNNDTNIYMHKQLYYIKYFGYINPVVPFDSEKMKIVEVYGTKFTSNQPRVLRNVDIINNVCVTKSDYKTCMVMGGRGNFTTYGDTFSYFNNIYLPMLLLAYTEISITNMLSYTYDGFLLYNSDRIFNDALTQQINTDITLSMWGGLCGVIEGGDPKEYIHPLDEEEVLVKSA